MPAIIDNNGDCIDMSKYLKAEDLQGRAVKVVIEKALNENVALPRKKPSPTPTVYFVGKKKPLIANTTNLRTLRRLFGRKVPEWAGKEIVLYPTETRLGKRIVPCIRMHGIDEQPAPSEVDSNE